MRARWGSSVHPEPSFQIFDLPSPSMDQVIGKKIFPSSRYLTTFCGSILFAFCNSGSLLILLFSMNRESSSALCRDAWELMLPSRVDTKTRNTTANASKNNKDITWYSYVKYNNIQDQDVLNGTDSGHQISIPRSHLQKAWTYPEENIHGREMAPRHSLNPASFQFGACLTW